MKNLAQHIETLLVQHECVIVPNLGGFVTYRDKAYVRNNTLYAPSQRVRFNPLLTYHDGLLAEAYMQDRKIGYSEALAAINADVEQITSSIRMGNTVLLGRIGALSQSANSIVLTNEDCKFLPENIGLPVVHLKQLAATTSDDNRITLNVPRPSTNFVRYAAMLIVVFIFSLLIPTPVTDATHEASFYFNAQCLMHNAQLEETPKLIESIDTITTIATIKTTQTSNSSLLTPNSSLQRYHLIIASLTSQAEAEEYIAHHKHFDADQLQIIESNGKYRISAAGFNKYKEALEYMDSIRNTIPSAKRAWIMCK